MDMVAEGLAGTQKQQVLLQRESPPQQRAEDSGSRFVV